VLVLQQQGQQEIELVHDGQVAGNRQLVLKHQIHDLLRRHAHHSFDNLLILKYQDGVDVVRYSFSNEDPAIVEADALSDAAVSCAEAHAEVHPAVLALQVGAQGRTQADHPAHQVQEAGE